MKSRQLPFPPPTFNSTISTCRYLYKGSHELNLRSSSRRMTKLHPFSKRIFSRLDVLAFKCYHRECLMHIKLTTCTEYRIQKRMYIKLLMHLFFYMALVLTYFDAFTSVTRTLKISTFLGPNGNSLRSLPFQGPPLPMALKMYLPASKSLRPKPYI